MSKSVSYTLRSVKTCLIDALSVFSEVVLTVENSSDSATEWRDAEGVLHTEWTPPNTALLVRSSRATAHMDTPHLSLTVVAGAQIAPIRTL